MPPPLCGPVLVPLIAATVTLGLQVTTGTIG